MTTLMSFRVSHSPNIRSAMTTFVFIVAEKSMETIQVDMSIQGMMLNTNTEFSRQKQKSKKVYIL
jgi:hypothetical protein